MAKIRVIGLDMGMNTMAVSIVDYNRSLSLVDSFPFKEALKSIIDTNLSTGYVVFVRAFIKLIKKYKPDAVYAERFQVRMRFMGASAEIIAYMLGIMHRICVKYKIAFVPITPASWKNAFNRVVQWPKGINKEYRHRTKGNKRYKSRLIITKVKTSLEAHYISIKPCPAHNLDSACIAVYGVGKHLNKPDIFGSVTKSFINEVCKKEKANAIKRK